MRTQKIRQQQKPPHIHPQSQTHPHSHSPTQPYSYRQLPNPKTQQRQPKKQRKRQSQKKQRNSSYRLQKLMKSRINQLKQKCLIMNTYNHLHNDVHLDADYLGAYNGFVNGIGTGGRAGGQFHLMNSGNNHGSSGCGGNVNEIKNNQAIKLQTVSIKYRNKTKRDRQEYLQQLEESYERHKQRQKQKQSIIYKHLIQQHQKQKQTQNPKQSQFLQSSRQAQNQRYIRPQCGQKPQRRNHKTCNNLQTIDDMKQKISKTLVKDLLSLQNIQQTLIMPKNEKKGSNNANGNSIKIKLLPNKKRNFTIDYNQCCELAESKQEQMIAHLKNKLEGGTNKSIDHQSNSNSNNYYSNRLSQNNITPKLKLCINPKYANSINISLNKNKDKNYKTLDNDSVIPLIYFIKKKEYCEKELFPHSIPYTPGNDNSRYLDKEKDRKKLSEDRSCRRGYRSQRKNIEELDKVRKEEFSPWEIKNVRYNQFIPESTDGFNGFSKPFQ